MYIELNLQFFQFPNRIISHLAILLFMVAAAHVSIATPFFKNVNEIAGIEFNHQSGKSKEKHMIETMGSGVILIDYNNDGLLDLYLVNSGDTSTGKNGVGNVLYRNNGGGTFTDTTNEAGLGDLGYGMGGTSADYDNDGDTDLYLANFGADSFYRNNGDGSFTEISQEVGIDNPDWAVAGAFLDYDLDGDLDLFIVNYLQYSLVDRQSNSGNSMVGYQHPRAFKGTKDKLYQNNGDGTFTDVSLVSGVTNAEEGRGMAVVSFDYDNDHWPDIYVANDTNRNFLYRNNGDGTFTDNSLLAGTGYDETGIAEGSMGVDCGDYNQDGWLDLIVANSETATLYRNDQHGFFVEATVEAGLSEPTFRFVGFSPIFFDYDHDTYLDIFSVNGHPQDIIEQLMDSETYAQVDQLFRNLGDGSFLEVSTFAGEYFDKPYVGRSVVGGDYDNDGDIDLLVSNSNQPAFLLRNEIGNQQNWLLIRLEGKYSNRDGIGSRVTVEIKNEGKRITQTAEVKSGSNYASNSDIRLHFGLGKAQNVDRIHIHWSRGTKQNIYNASVNQLLIIQEVLGQGQ